MSGIPSSPVVPLLPLVSGRSLPQLGLGVWHLRGRTLETAVAAAIDAGYRLIDTARIYLNERGVGRAIAAAPVPREELLVTSKIWTSDLGRNRTLRAADASLARLGLETIDLLLLHRPGDDEARRLASWRALAELVADGRVGSIGVSNFTPAQIDRLVAETGVVPAVNQIELHPRSPQRAAREHHDALGIVTQAWSPLGGSPMGLLARRRGAADALRAHPEIVAIARAHGRTPVQVLLRWHVQQGLAVIPRSSDPGRIAQNIRVFDFALSADEMARIDALGGS